MSSASASFFTLFLIKPSKLFPYEPMACMIALFFSPGITAVTNVFEFKDRDDWGLERF
jgi:hypothetical protein